MVTMEQIAKKAGVTVATVSNVLNGRLKAGRSDAAKRATKIRKIALELGYRLNRAAAATRTGRTGCIGMLSSQDARYSVRFNSFEQALSASLAERNLMLVEGLISEQMLEDPAFIPRIVGESLADALIINYVYHIPPGIHRLIGMHNRPAIWINSKHDANCIYPDDELAGFRATKYLLDRGHKKIVFGTCHFDPDPAVDHYSFADRMNGYTRAMKSAGLTPRTYVPSKKDFPDPYRDMEFRVATDLLSQLGDATALVHNARSLPLLLAAARKGIRFPDDVSLVSFENEDTDTASMGVTAIHVPFDVMGREVVRLLSEKLDNDNLSLKPVALKYDVTDGPSVKPR
jgi:DNA-binding LacI/PurR family transcriptional regulator